MPLLGDADAWSFLWVTLLNERNGKKPNKGQNVSVHYKGMLLDGTVFDSSYQRGEPISFSVGIGQVIAGWDEGIQMLNEGTKARFVIPSDLAYGPNGNPPSIPGNSVLEFEIELLEIQKPEPVPQVGDKAENK